ncbi:MAG: helix-turn-helix domain-containing protein [Anaerolineaceae bacterium]|nr:helix-turn-helix domain-containing protein [Anaerolineaceae bacterium]
MNQTNPRPQPYPGTQSVLRAMSLLKAFDDERREWGLAALAREVGLNKTTTFRLLTALESEGMVAKRPSTETYTLGPEIVVLGGAPCATTTCARWPGQSWPRWPPLLAKPPR